MLQQAGLPAAAAASQQQNTWQAHRQTPLLWLGSCMLGLAAISESRCEASSYAAELDNKPGRWLQFLHNVDPRRAWKSVASTSNVFIDEMQIDSKVPACFRLFTLLSRPLFETTQTALHFLSPAHSAVQCLYLAQTATVMCCLSLLSMLVPESLEDLADTLKIVCRLLLF